MEEKEIQFSYLVDSLSKVLDLISPSLVNHHRKVSYIAFNIARKMGLSEDEQHNILEAGALHDIGVLTHEERIHLLEFDFSGNFLMLHLHGYVGYLMLKDFKPFEKIANFLRFHHVWYEKINDPVFKNKEIPLQSHIIHLADRISILIDEKQEILGQVKKIVRMVEKNSGTMFMPELVNVFKNLSNIEQFWLDLVNPYITDFLFRMMQRKGYIILDLHGLNEFFNLISKIIDFRSHFTATHSHGVASSAEALARLFNFSEIECRLMKYAGLIHDLGKIAIPVEILEKSLPLTQEEKNIIKSHTFHGYRIMEKIPDFTTINEWAFLHHERLDGSGYPFHLNRESLCLGSRIMAVADIFSALSEDRPYRKGMNIKDTMCILKNLAKKSLIDEKIISVIESNIKYINSLRISAQKKSHQQYMAFRSKIDNFVSQF